MGRTSKFSFPIPGRKYSSSTKETSTKPSTIPTQNLSKAQRLLGTENDLNIDSPLQDAFHFRPFSPKSSRMSIAISESTTEDESIQSQSEQWDRESGVLPRNQNYYGTAYSSSFGSKQRYGDDGATSTTSGRLRHEDSSSTLKNEHYDRQNSPLSISQQTSASSARDLALRKGFPPVVQRSPLLQVESVDQSTSHNSKGKGSRRESRYQGDFSQDRGSRKKPAKLDLSMLFPVSRRRESRSSDADSLAPSQTSQSTKASRGPRHSGDPARRKLPKVPSKESFQSKNSVRSSKPNDSKHSSALTGGTLYQLYDHYEQMSSRSPRMNRIDEPNVADRNVIGSRDDDKYSKENSYAKPRKGHDTSLSPADSDREPFSWKNVRASMAYRNEASSAASVSSWNTKTSRHTSGSGFSGSDLKVNSVLSLSSDSEDGVSDREAVLSPVVSTRSKASRASSHINNDHSQHTKPHSRQHPNAAISSTHSSRHGSRKPVGQERLIHSIPETSSVENHYPRRTAKDEPPRSTQQRLASRQSSQKDKKPWKEPIVSTTPLQPTPPRSPSSTEQREGSIKSGRLMTVTKQEEALLEALRQKRARMKEQIIEEHEITKSPPQKPVKPRSRHSQVSSQSTIRAGERERILLYLEAPVADSHHIDKAEPSPDLSDFLSFGSDDDSTPRSSWVPPRKSHARTSSNALPSARTMKNSPVTPPSAARLSAVGAPDFLAKEPGTTVKKRNTGVRFVDEPKAFLLDDTDNDVAWGM